MTPLTCSAVSTTSFLLPRCRSDICGFILHLLESSSRECLTELSDFHMHILQNPAFKCAPQRTGGRFRTRKMSTNASIEATAKESRGKGEAIAKLNKLHVTIFFFKRLVGKNDFH